MSGNSIGKSFTVTTFGESHGKAIGCIVDGVPPLISIREEDIQIYLDFLWFSRIFLDFHRFP